MSEKEPRKYGTYVKIMKEEPETSAEMRNMLKTAICTLLDKDFIDLHVPDWNTLKFIIHEGFEFVSNDPDWYADEKEGYSPARPTWMLTVGMMYTAAKPEG